MKSYSSTSLPGGQTNPQPLSAPSNGNINSILVINSSGFVAYIGDSNKIILFTIPAGQGLSIPYRSGGALYAWTDASVSNAGFGTNGDIRITLTTDELRLSGGVLIDAYNLPPSPVISFNGRTGPVALTSNDVSTALAFTPADATNIVNTFNTRKGPVTLTSGDVTGALAFTPADATNVVNTFNTRKGPVTLTSSDVRSVNSGYTNVPTLVAVTASPFVYQNAATYDCDMYVTGGTVSLVEFSRDNITFYPVTPYVLLSPNDRMRITYTVVPTLLRIPR